MSIFGSIIENIWHKVYPVVKETVAAAEAVVEKVVDAAEDLVKVVTDSPAAREIQERILDAAAARHKEATGETLEWRTSVVDLLKLVDIDSSQANRKALATEMGMPNYDFSAAENVELSKRVLAKLRGG
jgi:hypothetical protein